MPLSLPPLTGQEPHRKPEFWCPLAPSGQEREVLPIRHPPSSDTPRPSLPARSRSRSTRVRPSKAGGRAMAQGAQGLVNRFPSVIAASQVSGCRLGDAVRVLTASYALDQSVRRPPGCARKGPLSLDQFTLLAGILTAVIASIGYVGLACERSRRQAIEADQEYRAIIGTSLDGFFVFDRDGHFLDVNQAYCDMVGYRREELLTMRVADIDAADTGGGGDADRGRRWAIQPTCFEARQRRKDGRFLNVEASTRRARRRPERG